MNNRLFYSLPEGKYLLYNDYDIFILTVGEYKDGTKMWIVKTKGYTGYGLYIHEMDLEDVYEEDEYPEINFQGNSYRFSCSEDFHGTRLRGGFYPWKYSFYGKYSEEKVKELTHNRYWLRKNYKPSDKIYRMHLNSEKQSKEFRKKWSL